MSNKVRSMSTGEAPVCDKYLHRMMRQENMSTAKKLKTYQEKIPNVRPPVPLQRPKPRPNPRHQSPVQRVATQIIASLQKEDNGTVSRNSKASSKVSRLKPRSASESRSRTPEREAWGQLLVTNKSKDRVSNFSNFDPLRTLHFLSKELHNRLLHIIPDEEEVIQMIIDIKHALKRIPPEVSTLLHDPFVVFSKQDVAVTNASCQTPPTLYQEDTEKFQKIMEENTFRLEASCKQLELVCTNLQAEKELTEKELEEAKDNVEMLCRRVKELEVEMEEMTNMKVKQLENEKQRLQAELDEAIQEVAHNPRMNHLRSLVEELKQQKTSSENACAKLEYDMTLLKMENEKFATLLSVRDREIKDIQDEMTKIQENLHNELKKINGDIVKHSNSMKSLDPLGGLPENFFLDKGDTTLSSVETSESDKDLLKEFPCGDAQIHAVVKKSHDALSEDQKTTNDQSDLQTKNDQRNKVFDELMSGLSPSCRALIQAQNLD